MKKVLRTLLVAALLIFPIVGINKAEAKSTYTIKINKQQNCVTIYQKQENGKLKPIRAMVCSVGYATPLGTFNLKEKIRWHTLDGPVYGQYCTRITGSILFHSVWYYKNGQPSTLSYTQFNKLGTTASHGCVRLCVRDSKWIYDNVPSGTPVTIYNSKDPGPLGKPNMIKLSGYSGWDPTDVTNSMNPFNKKRPVIEGAVNKNITFAAKYNILKGIKARNTVGGNAKKLLKTTVLYKQFGKKNFVKVKKVKTKKPGVYKITYILKDEIDRKVQKTVSHKILTYVAVKSIKLNKSAKTLSLGKEKSKASFTLKAAKILPKKASIKEVLFKSSDNKVATVNKKGVVTAKKAGTAMITVKATDGSRVSVACKITVKQYATGISLTLPSYELAVGHKMTAQAAVKPATVSKKNVAYSSSRTDVATIDSKGMITAVAPGTATITAMTTDGTKKMVQKTITVYYEYGSASVNEINSSYEVNLSASEWDILNVLPKTITVKTTSGETATAAITWNVSGCNTSQTGEYTIYGSIQLPVGWRGSAGNIQTKIIVK